MQGADILADGGLCGVQPAREGAEGRGADHDQVAVRGGRFQQQPHRRLGLLVAGWPLGLQVLSLHHEKLILHRYAHLTVFSQKAVRPGGCRG